MYVDTQVRPQGELVDAVAPTKLKLSEAIRIGAKIRPKATGRFFKNGGSCALGAAYEAMYGFPAWAEGDWPFAFQSDFINQHPGANKVWYMNDHGQSRESIADWLEAQGL